VPWNSVADGSISKLKLTGNQGITNYLNFCLEISATKFSCIRSAFGSMKADVKPDT
jgi:hypothetical protein